MDVLVEHKEFFERYITYYLNSDKKEDLFKEIVEHFPESTNSEKFYLKLQDLSSYYQGDGVGNVPFIVLNSHKEYEIRYLPAVILSNTCDINLDEKKKVDEDLFVVYAARFTLNNMISALRNRRVSEERIQSFIHGLKRNEISHLFYLPPMTINDQTIIEESFVRFDLISSLPIPHFYKIYNTNYKIEGDRFFTLSDYGFYLFIIKLAIHFCRFSENVFRNS
jgi:hypothetical protein